MKRWRKQLQWCAGLALLALLGWQLDASAIGSRLLALEPLYVSLALACAVAANALSALRWRGIAADMGCEKPTEGFLVRYAQGVCLNTVLPGATLGGDAWRGAWLVEATFTPMRAGLTVLLDRISGLWALAAMAWVGNWAASSAVPDALWLGFALLTLAPLGIALPMARRWAGQLGIPPASSPLWRRASVQSVGVQVLTCASFWLCCRALDVSLDLPGTLVLGGGLFIAAALPASVFGFGSREAAAAWLFPALGVNADAGVAASIAFGLLGTLQGVMYLPLWWRRH